MFANVQEVKSQLSKLLDAARRGEEVFITRRGERFQIVRAIAVDRTAMFGILEGIAVPTPEEWARGDAAVLADFEEGFARDDQ
jgi:antitoxin (DNA-binding transcriptional repressor) of toxin-antitoxin stability system